MIHGARFRPGKTRNPFQLTENRQTSQGERKNNIKIYVVTGIFIHMVNVQKLVYESHSHSDLRLIETGTNSHDGHRHDHFDLSRGIDDGCWSRDVVVRPAAEILYCFSSSKLTARFLLHELYAVSHRIAVVRARAVVIVIRTRAVRLAAWTGSWASCPR